MAADPVRLGVNCFHSNSHVMSGREQERGIIGMEAVALTTAATVAMAGNREIGLSDGVSPTAVAVPVTVDDRTGSSRRAGGHVDVARPVTATSGGGDTSRRRRRTDRGDSQTGMAMLLLKQAVGRHHHHQVEPK